MSRLRTLRGRLAALAFAGAVVAVAVPVVAFNLLFDTNLRGDLNSRLRAQAEAASTTIGTEGGRIEVRESPSVIDAQVWVFAGRRDVLRPRDSPEVQAGAAALAGQSDVFATVESREVRLYALGVRSGRRQLGTVVVAQSLAPYDHASDVALVGSAALALALLSFVSGVTWFALGRALAPVEEMTRSAAAWSEGDPERRFGAAPRPDELARLARTFDGLLDRLAAGLRHEQRLSSELSHELRTPLARIIAEMDMLQRRERPADERREAYGSIARAAEQMSRILETLMTAARAESRSTPRGRTDLVAALGELAADWRGTFAEDGAELELRVEEFPLVAGVDAAVLERVVAPLLENARRHARERVVLGARRENGGACVTVRDDGDGIPREERERIFEPGVRGEEAGDGAGLGLALSRRLARAAGGDVVAGEADPGALFTVHLPA